MRVIDEKEFWKAKREKRVSSEMKQQSEEKPKAPVEKPEPKAPDLTPILNVTAQAILRSGQVIEHNMNALDALIEKLESTRDPVITVSVPDVPRKKISLRIVVTERDRNGLIKFAEIDEK